jgi:mRNA-degrading endonuclease RelE of RelBE toxin-antitoxin system
MSEELKEIDVYETNRFTKALGKLPDERLKIVEDEIDKIIDNPTIGEQKKGDLSYLFVHKFYLEKKQVLLGYAWVDGELELYLLSINSHENFYSDMKKKRKADLKLIGS